MNASMHTFEGIRVCEIDGGKQLHFINIVLTEFKHELALVL